MNTKAKRFYLASSGTLIGAILAFIVTHYTWHIAIENSKIPANGDGSGMAMIVLCCFGIAIICFITGLILCGAGVVFYLIGLDAENAPNQLYDFLFS